MKTTRLFKICLIFLTIFLINFGYATNGKWVKLRNGFFYAQFDAKIKSSLGDSKITILKIDASLYEIDFFCQSEYKGETRTLKKWAQEFNLIAAINAGMYATDYKTSIGFLRTQNHVNNGQINRSHKTIFACNPVKKDIEPIQLIDRQYQDFKNFKTQYHSFLQSIRMISAKQKNVWQQQPHKKYSIAALGLDSTGNLLLIHSRSVYTVHDFIEILLDLPIGIKKAMYLEGGPPASLYFNVGAKSGDLIGNFSESTLLGGNNQISWEIPNVLGIKIKKEEKQ